MKVQQPTYLSDADQTALTQALVNHMGFTYSTAQRIAAAAARKPVVSERGLRRRRK